MRKSDYDKPISLRIPRDLKESAKQCATMKGISLSQFIRDAITYKVNRSMGEYTY